ncbi:MAG: VOC family protein [Aeromicrobium sp.]
MPTPQITLGAVNLEAHDPTALSQFWAAVTGATTPPAGETVYLPPAGPDGFAMFFQPVGGAGPARQRMHLDLTVPWGSRQTEVDRIIGLGAAHRWDVLAEHPPTPA